jgi:hypothetical protein
MEISTIYSNIFIIYVIIQFKFCHKKCYNGNYVKSSDKIINVSNWSCDVFYFTKGTVTFISVNFHILKNVKVMY